VHDADNAGGVIYETLQYETKARGARKIQIVNFGLEPWEAIRRGLQVETFKADPDRRRPIADYVLERDRTHPGEAPGGGSWEEWLQTHRVELNAMKPAAFIRWLNEKMAEHIKKHKLPAKLTPPDEVIADELAKAVEDKARVELTERILREAGFEEQVAEAVAQAKTPNASVMRKGIDKLFNKEPASAWRDHVKAVVAKLKF
jgi:hypothetical protein